ncbi:hypothetical protein GCM10009641_69390 [Mycobacterium cookii]|uniref:Uncharacterized protein n=1 Tax=Nocardioides furvisabuli TaxID=375542 RepID=A0ABP5IDP3_9ACTN|nr:hypothetical protein [Nocardioides furvisabuli]
MYVPAAVDVTPDQRIVEAAAVLRADEAVTGWAALRWQGAAWFEGTDGQTGRRDVPLLARRDRAAPTGAMVSQEFLHPDQITTVDGVPVTLPVRSVVHEMRYADTLGEAVVALDMACYSDLVSLAEVTAYVATLGPVTGIQQARDALVLGEENSWSPKETAMRGVWTMRAGLLRPLCNAPVFTLEGRHVGTPDLIDPELGLVAQYNGSDHISLAGTAADVNKDASYRDLGLERVTMLVTDWGEIDDFTRRLLEAAGRASARTAPRRWRIEPPTWWTPTHTVERRRALPGLERERLLGYRRTA